LVGNTNQAGRSLLESANADSATKTVARVYPGKEKREGYKNIAKIR